MGDSPFATCIEPSLDPSRSLPTAAKHRSHTVEPPEASLLDHNDGTDVRPTIAGPIAFPESAPEHCFHEVRPRDMLEGNAPLTHSRANER
ncbi:MAG: hypothetical protein QM784_28220 [Polyangiaceae bacterium]